MSLENRRLTLVEDDPIMGESLAQRLELEGASVTWWRRADQALSGLGRTPTDAVICDIRLPDSSGEELYRAVLRLGRTPPFLFVTGFGDVAQAVRLMREGAHDYVTKPFEMDDFLARLEIILRPVDSDCEPALGISAPMREVEHFLRRAARVGSSLLLTGETGVGKEVAARFLHFLRDTPSGPFMAVNCAALPAELMESELFGHEKGAFSGAHARHLGYAERAGNGVLFLDEIGELPPKLQAKLLRLIEERSFHRVGGEQSIAFKARLVCATNADLKSRVAAGTFRDDLLYRINVLSLNVPALRERSEDIPWLMDRLFADIRSRVNAEATGFSSLAYAAAESHAWPGNVRELRNRIERAAARSTARWIMPGDLFPEQGRGRESAAAMIATLAEVRDDAERRQIERSLATHGGQVQKTAEALGISRTTLWEKMKRYGLSTGQTHDA